MADLPKDISILEVGLRDGLQIEPRILATDEKLALAEHLVAAGLRDIEIGSFVSPRLVPQMADTKELAGRLSAREGVTYRALWLNLRGLRETLACPAITVDGLLSLSASEAFAQRNTNRGIDDDFTAIPGWIEAYRGAGIEADTLSVLAAFGCNFQGAIPTSDLRHLIAGAIRMCCDNGAEIRRITLCDTMGWATPLMIRRCIAAIRETWPEMIIRLHLHDTRGLAIANAQAALELGVREFETSIGGMGGCPFSGNALKAAGNLSTEDLAFLCQANDVETGLDLEALISAAHLAETLIGHDLPGKLMKSGRLILPRPD
ncbi:hydroxymethylglutaryl-CoA lyase [Bosea sp. Root483D1]|uniref:hydroxymethylglutaryl-CoA lyase n=1 Tax=Bosea sp. Root483D1 TaxID=1736544 RepID=UPI00070A9D9F|nr:hydroxymethylglutaryl-CoA lyase [Bosea sp. Root483D1]KRE17350.1 hydroxymethylglutaryl-CoA lyase [Bosea sp. Root483D1]